MKFIIKKSILVIACITALVAVLLSIIIAVPKKSKTNIPQPTPAIKTIPTPEKPAETKIKVPVEKILGFSIENREIKSYTFGNGETRLVFVGGIHGGYEWNSVLLAYQFIDYLNQNPEFVPENTSVTVIPEMNPDGVFKIIGKEGRFNIGDVPAGTNEAGRFNARAVDLNRNFDCDWKASGFWQSKPVSGGTSPFSEPESAAIKKFLLETKPKAVVFWHSKSGTVYGSGCNNPMLSETVDIMNLYAKATGYKTAPTFDQYPVSGDASDWLASIGIPAITAELKTHETIEWERNLAGIKALTKYYGSKK